MVDYNAIMDNYPDLFECRDNEFYFIDELKIIYVLPLRIIDIGIAYSIVPKEPESYDFNLSLGKNVLPPWFIKNSQIVDLLMVPRHLVLPDQLCMLFFNHGLSILGYDKVGIMRRYSIKNIING